MGLLKKMPVLTHSPQSVPNSPREFLFILFLNPGLFLVVSPAGRRRCAAKTLLLLAKVRPDLTHALTCGGSPAGTPQPLSHPLRSLQI